MDLWSYPWWMLSLYSLTALFMLLFAIFIASYSLSRRRPPRSSGATLASTSMDVTTLAYTALSRIALNSPSGSVGPTQSRLSTWATRIFIAIVLQCTAIYLISTYPGTKSPLWLGIILQGFTYGSAAVCCASWGKESNDD